MYPNTTPPNGLEKKPSAKTRYDHIKDVPPSSFGGKNNLANVAANTPYRV
jgi:hypothetical protein